MRDHNRCGRVAYCQCSLQPRPALAVPLLGVIGRDQALRWETKLIAWSQVRPVVVDPDGVAIGQVPTTFELDQFFELGAEIQKISPERAAEEPDATKGDFVVFQEMDPQIFCLAAHVRKSATPMCIVELVVTGHVDDLFVREHLSGTGQASTFLDIACQDHDVSLLHGLRRRREGVAFEVQVAVDEEAHGLHSRNPSWRK